MTTSIVDIFNTYKNESDTTADSVATTYANLDIEWVVKNGNQTISANTSWGSATADTRNLLVLVKGNLTVDAGYTLTAAARKRGMFIYVNGDLNLNGIISMTARGASAAGAKLLLFDDGTEYQVPATGGAGGAGVGGGGIKNGNTGTSGVVTGACGGGGSGGEFDGVYLSGDGAAGTSYSGGSGGGGSCLANGGDAISNGGAGGAGVSTNSGQCSSGGAGNPGGAGDGYFGGAGSSGTGGLLVVYVTGTLTFGAAGTLSSIGSNGGATIDKDREATGGGSGGGRIDYFYNAVSGTPTVTVTGGVGGTKVGGGAIGGNGGAGSSRATEVSLPDLMATAFIPRVIIF